MSRRIRGVYEALVEHERARYERRGSEAAVIDGVEIGRKSPAGVDADGQERWFFYSRRYLNQLEPGATVTVGRGGVELALRLPFDRSVRRVRVSPDNRIVPTAAENAQ